MGTVAAPPPSNARKGAYVKHMQAIHKEQHRSIQQKHGQEMVLLDSIKGFFKQRFALERQHFEALSKICSSQCRAFDCIKKLPNSDPDNPNEPQPYESNIFSTWIEMLQSIEEKASNYASSLQTLETEILKDVKKLKACKQQRMKKFFDRVSFLQKEVEGSVSELDRTKQIYFKEESSALETHEAAKNADDIARGRKKDVKSFFQSKAKLKNKAGGLSVKQEELDIKSTGARNDYILSLTTANAHRERYHKSDLPEIIQLLEAEIYDKVKHYYSRYMETELEKVRGENEIYENLYNKNSRTSRNINYQLFGVAYPSLTEHVTYALENCPGDTIDKITTSEHDGGYSLNYEARQNASKLNQAVKTINAFEKRTESCQYHRAKGLTREPNDTGGPDLETKIVELQIAISNAQTDKAKAEARLDRLREGGIAVDEYIDAFVVERRRQQEVAERQRALDAQNAKAEADPEAANDDQDDDNFDLREARADSFDDDVGAKGGAQPYQMAAASQPIAEEDNWAAWDQTPAQAAAAAAPVAAEVAEEDWAAFDNNQAEPEAEPMASNFEAEAEQDVPVQSTEGMRQVYVLYNFDAQNGDELTINENEMVFITDEECDEEGWAVCITNDGRKGYVPLNYLDLEAEVAVGAEATEANGTDFVPESEEPKFKPMTPVSPMKGGMYDADPFASAAAEEPVEDDNWGNAFPGYEPTPAPVAAPAAPAAPRPIPAQPSVLPVQPPPMSEFPPWQSYEDEANSSELSDDESEEDGTSAFGGPPSAVPPPIPDCPPPISEFTGASCDSISNLNSLSTFGNDYCVGMYDYDATGSDEISFRSGDKIKILNRMPNGVDDGWWKGMVKTGSNAGKQGLFPSIICEPLNDSDSCKTEDSIESPTDMSFAPPSGAAPPMAPPPMSPPKTGNAKENSLNAFVDIEVTAPTPTVQSPVQPPEQPPRPKQPPAVPSQPPGRPAPVQPPRPAEQPPVVPSQPPGRPAPVQPPRPADQPPPLPPAQPQRPVGPPPIPVGRPKTPIQEEVVKEPPRPVESPKEAPVVQIAMTEATDDAFSSSEEFETPGEVIEDPVDPFGSSDPDPVEVVKDPEDPFGSTAEVTTEVVVDPVDPFGSSGPDPVVKDPVDPFGSISEVMTAEVVADPSDPFGSKDPDPVQEDDNWGFNAASPSPVLVPTMVPTQAAAPISPKIDIPEINFMPSEEDNYHSSSEEAAPASPSPPPIKTEAVEAAKEANNEVEKISADAQIEAVLAEMAEKQAEINKAKEERIKAESPPANILPRRASSSSSEAGEAEEKEAEDSEAIAFEQRNVPADDKEEESESIAFAPNRKGSSSSETEFSKSEKDITETESYAASNRPQSSRPPATTNPVQTRSSAASRAGPAAASAGKASNKIQRVDTADSDSSDDSSKSEGPVVKSDPDSDTDSSDHVVPDDLHVKQLKKLDTLKESSA